MIDTKTYKAEVEKMGGIKKDGKEFHDLRIEFEKDMKRLFRYRLDREKGDRKGEYYQDGNVNEMFQIYMSAYILGRDGYIKNCEICNDPMEVQHVCEKCGKREAV